MAAHGGLAGQEVGRERGSHAAVRGVQAAGGGAWGCPGWMASRPGTAFNAQTGMMLLPLPLTEALGSRRC